MRGIVGIDRKPDTVDERVLLLISKDFGFCRDFIMNGDNTKVFGLLLAEGVGGMTIFNGQPDEGLPLFDRFARLGTIPERKSDTDLTRNGHIKVLVVGLRKNGLPVDADKVRLPIGREVGVDLLKKGYGGRCDKGRVERRGNVYPSQGAILRVAGNHSFDQVFEGRDDWLEVEEEGIGPCNLTRQFGEKDLSGHLVGRNLGLQQVGKGVTAPEPFSGGLVDRVR